MGNNNITDKKDISNTIGQTISKNSLEDNMSPKYTTYKNKHVKKEFHI